MKLLFVTLVLASTQAFAWGPTGHRVVAEVAEKHLDTVVLIKIRKIIGQQSLAKIANWPDEIKSEPQTYSHTYNWHYTDWADEAHDHDEASSQGKLLTSIREQESVLKDPNAAQDKKVFAIKFLVHLIGDLHQPLHVGNGIDQGGNFCKVSFHGKNMNLHVLWDESLIDHTQLSFTELAKFVAENRTQAEIKAWKTGDVLDWALESKNLRAQIYPAEVIPNSRPMSMKSYCVREVTPDQVPKLGYEYSYKFVPVVEQKLFQAGLRLASLLNEALK